MEDTVKIFLAGLRVWAKRKKINQGKLADVIGRGQTTISDYFNDVTRPDDWMISEWVARYELDYEDILNLGRQEIAKKVRQTQPDTPPSRENTIVEIHQDIIKKFKLKNEGLVANQALLRIEQLDQKKFIDVVADLVKIAAHLEIEAGNNGKGLKDKSTG